MKQRKNRASPPLQLAFQTNPNPQQHLHTQIMQRLEITHDSPSDDELLDDDEEIPLTLPQYHSVRSRRTTRIPFLRSICCSIGCLAAILLILSLARGNNSRDESTRTEANHNHINHEDNTLVQSQHSCTSNFTLNLGWTKWKDAVGERAPSSWCRGTNNDCQTCPNPLIPGTHPKDGWEQAISVNQQLAQADVGTDLDMVLLGDSITEHWQGLRWGEPSETYALHHQVYKALFRGGQDSLRGLTLGIGGDTAPNLLYRLQNGEMPVDLQPKLWWILIGTNDLGLGCNADAIMASIVQIVQFIQTRRPPATIVLHSILPRGQSPLWSPGNSLWPSIFDLNQRMSCFAASQEGVEYFNGTDIFLTNDQSSVNTTLMPDALHPSAVASIPWGVAMIQKSAELLGKTSSRVEEIAESLTCSYYATTSLGWKEWTKAQTKLGPEEWCDRNNHCSCVSKFEPVGTNNKNWFKAFQRNKEVATTQIDSLDLIIMGDSIVEHWQGTDRSNPMTRWESNHDVYQQLFRESGSLVRGLALGIGGDKIENMMYRLIMGEVPPSLSPSQFWILIGTNDLSVYCTADVIVAGIIMLSQLVLKEHPSTTVVLHSILPRGIEPLETNDWWKLIADINSRLECFASGEPNVEYFDGTDFFLTEDKSMVNHTLMADYLHPTGLGSLAWGEAIVRKSLDLLGRPEPDPDAFNHIVISSEGADTHSGPSKTALVCEKDLLNNMSWDQWFRAQREIPPKLRCYGMKGQNNCHCMAPAEPSSRAGSRWESTLERNKQVANLNSQPGSNVSMVMLGDSIMEFWAFGTYLGNPLGTFKDNPQMFNSTFQTNSGSSSIALGISGDVSVELLYRINNGELPENLNPEILWLLIGTNDIGRTGCNYKVTAAAILTVMRELQRRKPNAVIVVNALLPREKLPFDNSPIWDEVLMINKHLECYVKGHSQEKLRFVNDTDLFMTDDQTQVNQTMLGDFLHPSFLGYQLWGQRIAAYKSQLLEELNHEP